jgi:hypothetical protein
MKPILCPLCNGAICANINYDCGDCFYSFDDCLQDKHDSCECLAKDILKHFFRKYPQYSQTFIDFPATNPENENNANDNSDDWNNKWHTRWRIKRIINFIEMDKDAENYIHLEDDLFEVD